MIEIEVNELCFVNDKLGTWNSKTKTAIVCSSDYLSSYIKEKIRKELKELDLSDSQDTQIRKLNKKEIRDFQYKIDQLNAFDEKELLDRIRLQFYLDDFEDQKSIKTY